MYLQSLNAETGKSKILCWIQSNKIKFGTEKSGETWNLTATLENNWGGLLNLSNNSNLTSKIFWSHFHTHRCTLAVGQINEWLLTLSEKL